MRYELKIKSSGRWEAQSESGQVLEGHVPIYKLNDLKVARIIVGQIKNGGVPAIEPEVETWEIPGFIRTDDNGAVKEFQFGTGLPTLIIGRNDSSTINFAEFTGDQKMLSPDQQRAIL